MASGWPWLGRFVNPRMEIELRSGAQAMLGTRTARRQGRGVPQGGVHVDNLGLKPLPDPPQDSLSKEEQRGKRIKDGIALTRRFPATQGRRSGHPRNSCSAFLKSVQNNLGGIREATWLGNLIFNILIP